MSPTMKNSSSPGVIARFRPPPSGPAGIAAAAPTGTLGVRGPRGMPGLLPAARDKVTGRGRSQAMPSSRIERIALNESAFRDLNENIESSVHRGRAEADLAGFVCECGDENCDQTVRMTLSD